MHYVVYLNKGYEEFKKQYPELDAIEFKGEHPKSIEHCKLYQGGFQL